MDRHPLFRDRRHAGRQLAERLKSLDIDAPVVVALPRGGVPVGYEVARELDAPLDIGLVRKLGAPGQPELGIGALGEGDTAVLDERTVGALGVSREELEAIVDRERAELERRRARYRRDHPVVDVAGRHVILVDDGLATGVTAVAAARVLRARGAEDVTVAVPVCPAGIGRGLRSHFDALICLVSPEHFGGVGVWYADFDQTSDQEVIELLRKSRQPAGEKASDAATSNGRGEAEAARELAIPARDHTTLAGDLTMPAQPRGLVIFVHGSGSSRHSPRNRAVAGYLNGLGFATLLFDLLTEREAETRRNVFDIELLQGRLLDATRFVRGLPELHALPIGYFGASTGAAAALRAAAEPGNPVHAVVSRGGRPDLAGDALTRVTAPTLLIVGGDDWNVLELNDEASALLKGPSYLAVIPGAGHLFEETGALEEVARLAGGWFDRYLRPGRKAPAGRGVTAA